MKLEDKCKMLLDKEWTEEEKALIQRIFDNVLYYQKLLPKSMKEDVIAALDLCCMLKAQLEAYARDE